MTFTTRILGTLIGTTALVSFLSLVYFAIAASFAGVTPDRMAQVPFTGVTPEMISAMRYCAGAFMCSFLSLVVWALTLKRW